MAIPGIMLQKEGSIALEMRIMMIISRSCILVAAED
jgi:hypothetical protein